MWGTIKGSCTVVRDFADICYHSYPLYLKELRDNPGVAGDKEPHTIRLVEVPSCIAIGIMALIVEIPLYTIIAVIKSPYMLFKGWQRLLEDLERSFRRGVAYVIAMVSEFDEYTNDWLYLREGSVIPK
ncbi:putative membrane protein [Acorus calamus]|uniref:Membrane protein n=1 Tax=Acorus calamus TaxID=4465 RepID=A0AAV9ELX4_ACOCL|nr:putative membrane protein [Acorus calamus]